MHLIYLVGNQKIKSTEKSIDSFNTIFEIKIIIMKYSNNNKQAAEATWKLTTIKKNLTCESNFWIDFITMRS